MLLNQNIKGLGWRADIPDIRDFTFLSFGLVTQFTSFPAIIDLRSHLDMPDIYDQGSLGSCTAHAVGALCDFNYGKDANYVPSRLFLYYVTRLLEGTVNIDAGATIRNTIKAANKFGVAQEDSWPYAIPKFKNAPSDDVFDQGQKYQALEYRRVLQRLNDLKECLYNHNLIAFGIGVYDGLYDVTRNNPVLAMPTVNQTLLGGHAICLVGFDDIENHFIARNSWGPDYGVDGYFYIPYNYVLNSKLARDFWIINLMER